MAMAEYGESFLCTIAKKLDKKVLTTDDDR